MIGSIKVCLITTPWYRWQTHGERRDRIDTNRQRSLAVFIYVYRSYKRTKATKMLLLSGITTFDQ